MQLILGIESSCDETGVALVRVPAGGGLPQLLGQETARVPQPGGLAGGLLGGLLDQNGDGKLDAGDLFKLGAGLFSKR